MKLTKRKGLYFHGHLYTIEWLFRAESDSDTMLLRKLHTACVGRFPMAGNVVPVATETGEPLPAFLHRNPPQPALLVIYTRSVVTHHNFFVNFLKGSYDLLTPDVVYSDAFIPSVPGFPVTVTPPPPGDIKGFTDESAEAGRFR